MYYQASTDKYKKFEGSGFSIDYIPNDAYRILSSSTYTFDMASNAQGTLSNKYVTLDVSNCEKGFDLKDKYTMTTSENAYVQAWYGDFKLPNSTMVVPKKKDASGKVVRDINHLLNKGYIGVVFDITCTDSKIKSDGNEKECLTISYGANNKNVTPNTNTSQWDYEGFLEFPKGNIGSPLRGKIKMELENGIWEIDDALYQQIKGTVVLYDTDAKASNDFG